MNFSIKHPENLGGMNERIRRLRQQNMDTPTTLSIERALIETDFYRRNYGTLSTPVLRARNFYEICRLKTIYIGPDELIVGERGPRPKAVPTFPELTCHTVEDLHTLDRRELQSYHISQADIDTYEREVIPYWRGKTQRERIFGHVSHEWEEAYHAGVFTEFMEQRAAGHTAMDGKMYRTGLLDVKRRIAAKIAALDFINDPEATDRQQELEAMDISCDAAILFAERHAELAGQMAEELARRHQSGDDRRIGELKKIAEVCRRVPAHAPRNLWEAIQMYWFVHLGTVTELNGWDSMNPGHLDQHLWPFYEQGLRDGTLTRDAAKELLSCLWIKFNNQPAPPKVGVTALESGTYNDFTNINIGGVDRHGNSAANELSTIILEIQEELHQLQPGLSIHIAKNTPDDFLMEGMRVIRQGHGYPSIFNPDAYVAEMVRAGKSVDDAREGGCSGCIEVGAFGKEAYLLTGYLNTPKILELALNDGTDPESGKHIGLHTGEARNFKTFDELYDAWCRQMVHFVNMKLSVNNYIERMFALYAPATFLSLFIDDCIEKGKDYYSGGARYNTTYIQCTGLGTITDSLSQYESNMSRAEQMRTHLYRGVARIRNYMPVTDDSTAKAIAKYYDSHGTPNDRMMAYYLLGCTYRDLGDTPMQIECLQKAAQAADTTRNDCDYYTMVSIYGHMANLYHKQVLPEEELKTLKELEICARKDNDTLTVLQSKSLLTRPYYLLKDTDKVLLLSKESFVLYKENGYTEKAATTLMTPISVALDRKQYKKAKEYLDCFEKESGLFDKDGNIQKGWEFHYFNKGRYLLGTEKTDSAIYFFMKALGAGMKEEAYLGLLSAYENKNKSDSIAKYAKLVVSTNDSAWFAKNSQTVEQMTAMYNYSRHKKQAEENMEKYINTQKKLLILSALLLISLCIIGTIIYYSKKKRLQHELKMRGLKAEYDKALLTLEAAQRDLKLLNYEMHSALEGKEKEVSNIVLLNGQTTFGSTTSTETIAADIASIKEKYRVLIENKNQDIEQLQSNVERLHKEIKSYAIAQEDEQLRNSEVYKKIKYVSSYHFGQKPLNDKDWTELTYLFRTCYPNYYSFITNNNNLSDNQLHVCMLIRLGFHQGEKCQIMNTSKSRINKIKQQINYKLFEEKGARSLSDNLRQHF